MNLYLKMLLYSSIAFIALFSVFMFIFFYQNDFLKRSTFQIKEDYINSLSKNIDLEDSFFQEQSSILIFEDLRRVADEAHKLTNSNLKHFDFLEFFTKNSYISSVILKHKNMLNSSSNFFVINSDNKLIYTLANDSFVKRIINLNIGLHTNNFKDKIFIDGHYLYSIPITDENSGLYLGHVFLSWDLNFFTKEYHESYKSFNLELVGVFSRQDRCLFESDLRSSSFAISKKLFCAKILNLDSKLNNGFNVINSSFMGSFGEYILVLKKQDLYVGFTFSFKSEERMMMLTAFASFAFSLILLALFVYEVYRGISLKFKILYAISSKISMGKTDFDVFLDGSDKVNQLIQNNLKMQEDLVLNFLKLEDKIQNLKNEKPVT